MVRLQEAARRTGLCCLSILAVVSAHLQPRASHSGEATQPSTTAAPTAVSDCHLEGSELHCVADSTEYRVHTTVTATSDIPPAFTGCHAHEGEGEIFCYAPNGAETEISLAAEDADHDSHSHEDEHEDETSTGQSCHFHAGVEHCTGGASTTPTCSRVQRDYNINLRIGLIFAMLATSTIGVYLPIFAISFIRPDNVVFTVLRQFGTGIIISTAFVHLFTHANLMFRNECLEGVDYEATAAAILMAGLFLSFLVEYIGARVVQWHSAKGASKNVEESSGSSTEGRTMSNSLSSEMINIYVLEAGIIFHSFLIGLTLVVSGDTFFLTLFVVIVFHQFFEGLALGTRIAALGLSPIAALPMIGHGHGHGHSHTHFHVMPKAESSSPVIGGSLPESAHIPDADSDVASTVSLKKKFFLAALFAFVTPAGMALGTGILGHFNGNDPSTIVAIGTLDAFSAGILVWVGVVEMWAHDWMMGGEMTSASPLKTALGLGALMLGMALMSLLGKWA